MQGQKRSCRQTMRRWSPALSAEHLLFETDKQVSVIFQSSESGRGNTEVPGACLAPLAAHNVGIFPARNKLCGPLEHGSDHA